VNNKIFRLVAKYVGPAPRYGEVGEKEEEERSRACVTLRLRPLVAGKTKVHVHYLRKRHPLKYRATVMISAFPSLRWLIPALSPLPASASSDDESEESGESGDEGEDGPPPAHFAVVSLHATATVQLVGGPQVRGHSVGSNSVDKWFLEDEEAVSVHPTDLESIGSGRRERFQFAHVTRTGESGGSDDGGLPEGRVYR
jgi:hypothetical protein